MNETEFKSNNQTSCAMTGGIDEFETDSARYPPVLSRADFFARGEIFQKPISPRW